MKFTRELPANIHVVRSYQSGSVRIGEQVITSNCLFNADEMVVAWRPQELADLQPGDFAAAMAWQPEIILLGTGARQVFPGREVYSAILGKGIGFEVMDTGAACRTYNVLVGESRRVAAALFL
jgi:uncharacterized protein